jgi:hypothetical protein
MWRERALKVVLVLVGLLCYGDHGISRCERTRTSSCCGYFRCHWLIADRAGSGEAASRASFCCDGVGLRLERRHDSQYVANLCEF